MTTARRRTRILLSLAIGSFATFLAAINYSHQPPGGMSDFDQVYIAARALLGGGDPYSAVRESGWPFPLYYPATAGIVVLPLALLPVAWARAAFMGVGTALCAWALSRERWYAMLGFLSGSYMSALVLAQWSPFMIGSAFLPPWIAGGLATAKPTVGLALVLAYSITPFAKFVRVSAGALLVLALSLIVRPSWPPSWWNAIHAAPHVIPLVFVMPVGPILLLAMLRWRRAEARLLLALALIPQTPALYGTLVLFLIPMTRMEVLSLVLLSDLAYFIMTQVHPVLPGPAELATHARAMAWVIIALLYLPCLAMILSRPNEGAVPLCLERLAARVRCRPRPATWDRDGGRS